MLKVRGKGMVSASGGTCAGTGTGTTCNQSYDTGTEVRLTATPQAGATFTGWSGACSGSARTCSVTLSGASSVTATFSGRGQRQQGPKAHCVPGASRSSQSRGLFSGHTLRFDTTQRGTAHVRAVRAGRVETALAFTIAPGAATIGPFQLAKSGYYAFELTLGPGRSGGRRASGVRCRGACRAFHV